jgi:hypothetical protein
VVVVEFCEVQSSQHIIASSMEFLGALDKLDVKGLELKNEQEDFNEVK